MTTFKALDFDYGDVIGIVFLKKNLYTYVIYILCTLDAS